MAEVHVAIGAVEAALDAAGLLRDFRGTKDVVVSGVAQDSRLVQPGDLFLAWTGTSSDGHDFVRDAASAGAAAAVVERPLDVAIPQLIVTDGRRAAALAAGAVMGWPAERLFAVGITGTNGKTTTAMLARHLLASRGPAVAIGTLGVVDDGGVRPGTEGLTTPGPAQVAVRLRELADGGTWAVAMEASSHALEQRRLDGIRFDVGVFTNLSQDHLDYHQDLASYFEAKARLVELVADDGALAVNRDDPAWMRLDSRGRRVRTFGVRHAADVRAENVSLGKEGSRFTLTVGEASAEVRLPLLGEYNVENALAAAAVALEVGMEVVDIARGLSTIPQIAGRLEAVLTQPYSVLIDFAHTPRALEGVLAAVKPLTRGRLIVVFGAGGDRDRGKRRPMAEAVARFADVVVLTSDNPRTEDPERILDDLAEGLHGTQYTRLADRRAAIRFALERARGGDTVVLAGKGHENHQLVGHERQPFDERVIVQECLAELGVA